MGEAGVAIDAGVSKRGVLVTAEGEDGLVHLLGVEDPQAHEEVKIFHGEAGHRLEEVGFELGDDILECVLSEIGEIHECGDAFP